MTGHILTLGDIEIIKQALRIASEDGSLSQFTTPSRLDVLLRRLKHLQDQTLK